MDAVAPRSAAPMTLGIERRLPSRVAPVIMSSSDNAPPLSSADIVEQARRARARAAELVAASHELRDHALRAHDVAQQLATEYASLVIARHAAAEINQEQLLLLKSDELRAAVEEYSRMLRSTETPPERSLVLVKTATSSLATVKQIELAPVSNQVTKWFVTGYYGSPS